MKKELLCALTEMSNRYGKDPRYVLAGGGNTSVKDEENLYVKPSGVSLAAIKSEDFVKLSRKGLDEMMGFSYPEQDEAREAIALEKLMASVCPGEAGLRPSVETPLHHLFPFTFVLHVHPAEINALTCAADGKKTAEKLFGDKILWLDFVKPGYTLAACCKKALDEYKKKNGKDVQILILQNHGVFYAANTVEEIDALNSFVIGQIEKNLKRTADFSETEFDAEKAAAIAPQLRMLVSAEGRAVVEFLCNKEIAALVENEKAFSGMEKPFTPDHIVYCKAYPLFLKEGDDLCARYHDYVSRNGFAPRIVAVQGLGIFVCGSDKKEELTAKALFLDAVKISVMSESFGGPRAMENRFIEFIIHWEVESYRKKMSENGAGAKRLSGKITLVTGGAQGFGRGLAEEAVKEGAYVIVADMNEDGAKNCAAELDAQYGEGTAFAVGANVSDEASVKAMFEKAVLYFGGLDILLNNAGIVRAGGLDTMTKQAFELVTSVNYTAYFLCVKYAAAIMKIQHAAAPDYMMDIIEINSKSGLAGSNKNFAYAGSKFGGIGLTQSFAMELAPENIKVNAICPGNFLDGPLWSDPEKGLFKQYLDAGKVEGAKTVADVKRYYEKKVPLGRGCRVDDVSRALFYIVEQKYETGQAVPVTGGQQMLH